ncbi:MAG: GNAT family N-acetyltransferase [Sumerlaeia bacterium]
MTGTVTLPDSLRYPPPPKTPRLLTERLIIRPPGAEDARSVLHYYTENRAHLEPFEPLRPRGFYTLLFWDSQLERFANDFRQDRAARLFFFDRRDDSRIVGYVGFNGITRGAAHFAYLGYSVAAECQGLGLMTEGVAESVRYGFAGLKLHRLMANYMPRNERSGRLLKRLGFVPEGFARDYLRINGVWEDHVLTSLTNPNWEESQ